MRCEEARRIFHTLDRKDANEISPCLNVGSSTLDFRTKRKPHIERDLFAPLAKRGVHIIHMDIKAGDGVDVVGDIFDSDCQIILRKIAPKLVLLNNVLEHVIDRQRVADICAELVAPGGYLLVTVPRKYPYHADPIDTLYRPTPQEIQVLFPHLEMCESDIITSGNALKDLSQRNKLAFIRYFTRVCLPFYKPKGYRFFISNLAYFRKSYTISLALFRKPV